MRFTCYLTLNSWNNAKTIGTCQFWSGTGVEQEQPAPGSLDDLDGLAARHAIM
jgi:hypothetical protein